MRGHIRKRGRSWTVVVDLGNEPVTGKRRQLWRSVKGPKRQAEALLVELLHERDTGVERPTSKLTVAAYFDRWLADYVAPSLAPKTASAYRDVIRNHFAPALGPLELVALRPSHIQSLYTRMLATLSPRSVLRYHQVLHAALHSAVRWQLLVRTPPMPSSRRGRDGVRSGH